MPCITLAACLVEEATLIKYIPYFVQILRYKLQEYIQLPLLNTTDFRKMS